MRGGVVLLVAPLVFRAPLVCCRSGLLGVPVGGGPPASRPRRELRSARRLEARPGPAAAHGRRSQALRSLRALHTSGACCAEDDSPRLEARPGPATAHGYLGRSHGPSGTAARPSGPSDALLWCACSGEEALLWIGTVLLDSSLTYPERKNLFRLLFPIQFGGVCRPGGLLAAWQWGVLHDMKSPGSVSPACVTPM